MKPFRILHTFSVFWLLIHSSCLHAQSTSDPILSSGGPLLPEQAVWDISYYDIHLQVFPETQRIRAQVELTGNMVHPSNTLLLNLDTTFTITEIASPTSPVTFQHQEGKLWIYWPTTLQPGTPVHLRIRYHGTPRTAPAPPWAGGFTWKKTASGAPWIGISCQMEGADLWLPVKDHPSDEPDSVSLHFTVPDSLIAASNGQFKGVTYTSEYALATYHWKVSMPINLYNITLNVAPYILLRDTLQSTSGEIIQMYFYILPEHAEKARQAIAEFKDQVRFLDKYIGPYPFQADKYGLAEAPFLGMEHQTLIAYGNNFKPNKYGYDWLHQHELAHEWWGNLVTAYDWRDFWLHEGFGSYMQPLYVEYLHGKEAYLSNMQDWRPLITNRMPVAPRASKSTREIYKLPPDYQESNLDIYYKGAWVLHTLRYLMGDSAFFTALREMAYPGDSEQNVRERCPCRFATTDDFLHIAERASGQKLDWFFEVYLRQAQLPRLEVQQTNNRLLLKWHTPNHLPFPMPVEVEINGKRTRIPLPEGHASLPLPPGATVRIDPDGWILKEDRTF